MATPETLSVEPDPFAPSFDGDLDVVESEENRVTKPAELAELSEEDVRELPPYSLESNDKTLLGIGASGPTESGTALHFDSSDRTLVGIGPAERAERAKRAESLSGSEPAEAAPESVPMPLSEPAGPFIVSDDEQDVPDRVPLTNSGPWVFAVSGVLAAVAAVAFTREIRHSAPARVHSAVAVAPLSTATDIPLHPAQLESTSATSTDSSAVDTRSADTVEAQPASALTTAESEKPADFKPHRAIPKLVNKERLGALDVSSNSPAGLVLDGRPLGKAPLVVQLPSGPHTVVFVHPERGRMSVTVNVRAGRTTTASANF